MYGASNGSITTAIDGGVSPFTFQWEDGPTTQNRTQLGGGFYVLQVIDANNCASVVQSSLSEPERDDWTMGGNANTNPANNFIGTTDNKDLVFKTNGQERMRIGDDGNFTMDDNSSFDKLLTYRITSLDSTIHFGDSSMVVQTNRNQIYSDGLGLFKGIALSGMDAAYGNTLGTAFGFGLNSFAIGNYIRTKGVKAITIGSGDGNSLNTFLENSADNTLYVGFNSNIPTLVVTPANGAGFTGNVGIGMTPNASYKLDVKGNIRACDVLVNHVNGCDYVFDNKYKLMPVSDLKTYLEINKHLPDIAPAQEMEISGIEVGAFSTQLLKKVEELTLYMIAQNEKIEQLKKQNELLEIKLNSLSQTSK